MTKNDERVKEILTNALKEAFGEHTESGRFVDITRIPLICKSIIDTSTKIAEINDKLDTRFVTKEAFMPVKAIVYGAIGIGGTFIVGKLLNLI